MPTPCNALINRHLYHHHREHENKIGWLDLAANQVDEQNKRKRKGKERSYGSDPMIGSSRVCSASFSC
jgi:hypothetical protein